MNYKLINANNIAFNSDGFITEKNIEKMPCIYADLPNGMDGEHYVLEQQSTLDKIRAEIAVLDDADYDYEGYYKAVTDAVKIIDKYKTESEG